MLMTTNPTKIPPRKIQDKILKLNIIIVII